jgi:hypothetical protein
MTVHFALHSTVRKQSGRLHRAQAAAHVRKKHYIGAEQLRLLPDRRLLISKEVLLRNLPELRQKAGEHILEVRALDGRLIDLNTLTPGPAAPVPPLPNVRLDSVAYDTPTGQYIPPYVGDDSAMPVVLPHGEKPALLKGAERELALDEEALAAETLQGSTQPGGFSVDDPELDAAIAAAQQVTAEVVPASPPAPSASKEVSSRGPRDGHRRRDRR